MSFQEPMSLLLILPWAVVAGWMLVAMPPRARVTHLPFWQGSIAAAPTRSRLWIPPLWVVACLLAVFVGIFAIAGPRWSGSSPPASNEPQSLGRIEALSARVGETIHVMVRARATRPAPDARVVITADGRDRELRLSFDESGYADAFLEVPGDTREVVARLVGESGSAADSRRRLVFSRRPSPVQAGKVSPELQRLINVYNRQAGGGSAPRITASPETDPSVPGLAIEEAELTRTIVVDLRDAGWQVADHPVVANVSVDALTGEVRVGTLPPGEWTIVLSHDAAALVAIRESPARQVWVGFASGAFRATPSFVILWTNIFRWLDSGESTRLIFAEDPNAGDDSKTVPSAGDRGSSQVSPSPAVSRPVAGDAETVDLRGTAVAGAFLLASFAAITWASAGRKRVS